MLESYYMTTRDAASVAKELKSAGYSATRANCTGYVCNVMPRLGGGDPGEQRQVLKVIRQVLEGADQ